MAAGAPPSAVPLRLGVQNLFLIRPVRIGGRRGVTLFDPGAQPERLDEYASELPGPCDVWAVNELFAAADVDRLASVWTERAAAPAAVVEGPHARRRRGQVTSSGLAAFVSGWSVVKVRRHRFRAAGLRRHDADPWAAKGVLLVGLRHRRGADLDLAVTHLHAGGYLGAEPPGAPAVRRAQVDEVFSFVESHRRGGVPLVVCGDWNIDGGAAGSAGGADDRALRAAASGLGLVDAWDLVGEGGGYTADCRNRLEAFALDPDDERYCAEPAAVAAAAAAADLTRIDRVFVTDSEALTVASMRRRLRRRAAGAAGFDRISTLSDHVGLDVELLVSGPATAEVGAP